MKTMFISLLLPFLFATSFAQNLNYSVHPKYSHPITKEKLVNARSMGDIIPYYPASWIDSYNSAEITATRNGKTETASSSDDVFSEEQIKMLGSLDFGSEIEINIDYRRKNSLTKETENRNMHYSATIVPDKEAQYPDGYEQLSQYIKGNAIDKISPDDTKDLQVTVVRFTITEKGKIADAHIAKTSGNPDIDDLLLNVIKDMPRWNPAADSQGTKVSQNLN